MRGETEEEAAHNDHPARVCRSVTLLLCMSIQMLLSSGPVIRSGKAVLKSADGKADEIELVVNGLHLVF